MELRVIPTQHAWASLSLGKALRCERPDAFLSPALQLPLVKSCPTAATHHGLAYIAQPECFSISQRLSGRLRTRFALYRADHLFAVSESMKAELVAWCGARSESVTVVHHGAPEGFVADMSAQELARVRELLGLPERYILASGRLSPRKNTCRLIRAYQLMRERRPDLKHALALAGGDDWGAETIHAQIASSKYKNDIYVLGAVKRDVMAGLTAGADASVLISLWESFGIPIIEAMAAGTPVITSNCNAMPEVAGDAALLVDPYDEETISDALTRLLTNTKVRQQCIARGLERVKAFTWRGAAEKVLHVLMALGAP